MATLEQLETALRNADAAGDANAARALANELLRVRSSPDVEVGPSGRPRITIRPSDPARPDEPQEAAGYGEDIAKSLGVGLGRGAIGLLGAVGDLSNLGAHGLDYANRGINAMLPDSMKYDAPNFDPSKSVLRYVPNSESITQWIENNVTGEFYKPKSRAGEYAQTVGEFLPGSVLGPGGVARNALVFGVAPALTSEAAGNAVKGTKAEPWVRGATALATGVIGGVATAPGNAARVMSRAGSGVTPQQFRAAEQLFQEAQAAGMPLTRAEAVQYITNGAANYGNLQRVVEGRGGMREFFAGRAASNDAAAGRAFESVTPATPNPSGIGPAVGTAAEDAINGVRGVINNATAPLYAAAENIRLTPAEMARFRALPGYEEARATVRNTPQLNRYVSHLPDDSWGFLNEVKKQLNAFAARARSLVATNPNRQIPAGYLRDASAARQVMIDASRRTPTNAGEAALNVHAQLRDQYLQPLLDGPIGKIAAKDTTTKKAIDVLFQNNPLPNSADEISTAVSAVARRNAYAARSLVRAHLEMTFNEATQNLASGVNSYGGAKFAAIVRGNPQQAANLEAAIRALPNGDRVWQGVDRFLTILEAQGQRHAIGSQTAFNTEVLQDLRQGKLAAEAGSAALSGGLKLPTKISERIERWRMGRNMDQLAYLFTDPNAGQEFARLAGSNAGRSQMGSIIRIVGLAHRGAQSANNK